MLQRRWKYGIPAHRPPGLVTLRGSGRSPARPGTRSRSCSARAATRAGAGASTGGCARRTWPRRRCPQLRERLHDQAPSTAAAGARRVRRRAGGRLGEPRAADGLRAHRPLEGDPDHRRPTGLVDRVLRGVVDGARAGCRPGAARWRDRLRAVTRGADRARGLPDRASTTGEPIHPDAAFTGTLPMFERAGFTVVADRASDPVELASACRRPAGAVNGVR